MFSIKGNGDIQHLLFQKVLFNKMLVIKTKNKKIILGIVKDLGRICWWKRTKTVGCTSTITSRINPFPRWWRSFSWFCIQTFLVLTYQKHKICQGCGEGIARWRIDDPNYKKGSGKRFLCCNNCVHFYDWHWSRKPIKLEVKNNGISNK